MDLILFLANRPLWYPGLGPVEGPPFGAHPRRPAQPPFQCTPQPSPQENGHNLIHPGVVFLIHPGVVFLIHPGGIYL
jgi:hypothetical protein